ncbi:MAG TPA: copper homeostasis protein CutC [Rhodanobacteraceae bacterium]|jgi:copper homeostasis protein|nr:copper homeostasis protein CutC [Rhodanobacteraceae bacterium]
MSEPVLEVAANSVASALAAQAGGAVRVELCAALELGGLTPSHAAIAMAQERLDIPVHVLIRPRAGDFVFDDLECEEMQRDIEACKTRGCAGVVLGILTDEGEVDVPRCRALMDAAQEMSVTFHRAFDFTRDPGRALAAIIALGCDRLLTSGQRADALAGAPLIRRLIEQARDRITIMPGGGITAQNIVTIAEATGAREFHASAKSRVTTRMDHRLPGRGEMDDAHWQTDVAEVRARVDALRTLSSSPQPPRRNPSQ